MLSNQDIVYLRETFGAMVLMLDKGSSVYLSELCTEILLLRENVLYLEDSLMKYKALVDIATHENVRLRSLL